MDRNKMLKTKWKPYMEITYKTSRMEEAVDCFLVAINFDDEIVILQPISDEYDRKDFHTYIGFCELPKFKMKSV